MEEINFKRLISPINYICSICRREIFSGKILCEECNSRLPENDKCKCAFCGRSMPFNMDFCDYCKNRDNGFNLARSAYVYEDNVRILIQKLKYGGEKYLADFFAEKLSKIYFETGFIADAIVFVPMTKKHQKKRGYNQSELLANSLSACTGLLVLSDCIEKVKDTKSQVGLNFNERQENLHGSFKVVNKTAVKDKNLILIDDVLTTGATSSLISERLKTAGATSVLLLTVASVGFKK